jgi:hypothetical protein
MTMIRALRSYEFARRHYSDADRLTQAMNALVLLRVSTTQGFADPSVERCMDEMPDLLEAIAVKLQCAAEANTAAIEAQETEQ